MDKFWTINGQASLIERGNPLLDPTPVELSNCYMLNEGAMVMRQGFATEDYSAGGLDGPLEWIARHLTNAGVEEAWAASDNGGTAELARREGYVWGAQSFVDTPVASHIRFMQSATMNGKFYLAYHSDVNRLHVWDGLTMRRVGLGPASAPTVTGGTTGTPLTRWYRVRNVVQASGVTVRRSEPGTSVSITDKITFRVTRGAVTGDGETHWELEAANASNGPWYRVATVPIATTFYDDANAIIPTTDPSDVLGIYNPPPSAKYLATDGKVLLMAGAWHLTTTAAGQTIPKQNRVWFTRPLGSSDISDDEAIPDSLEQRNYMDIGDAGPITGICGPVYAEFYVFKQNSIGKLVPTGDYIAPYAYVPVSDAYGAVDQRVICSGDLTGVPTIFFCDANAVYALTSGGVQCISEAIARDLRRMYVVKDTSLLAFDPLQRVLFCQVQSVPPDMPGSYRSFTFDVAKQRWSGFALSGAITGWVIGVGMIGATTTIGGAGAIILNAAYLENPDGGKRMYLVGQATAGVGAMFRWGERMALDGDAPYPALATYRRAFAIEGGRLVTLGNPTVWYSNPQGSTTGTLTLTVSIIRDDTETRSQSVTLQPTTTSSGIAFRSVTFESLMSADVTTADLQLLLTYSGAAYRSVTGPAIHAVSVPLIWQQTITQ